jgi:hypothetical protein
VTGIPPSLAKEFRALFPLWIACIIAIAVHPLVDNRTIEALSMLAYPFGALALGAHALGHEYGHRTLGILLVQPIERRTLLLTKFAVLTPLLLAMGFVAWHLILSGLRPVPDPELVLLPVFGGLFVAPWLTMIARNQLGGVMLAGMAGGWSLFTTTIVLAKMSDWNWDHAERRAVEIWVPMMYVFAAIAAALAWRTFVRLEAIEGGGKPIHLPPWFRTAGRAQPGHPVWQLVKKELRLQQLAFVMAGLYVAAWAVSSLSAYLAPWTTVHHIVGPLTAAYLAGVALLVGSLASAEERQCGMVDSQQLLPMAASQQWMIKAGVAMALAVLLAIGVPTVLMYAGGPTNLLRGELPNPWNSVVVIAALTASSLYVSSLSGSGAKALAVSAPFVIVMFMLAEMVSKVMSRSLVYSAPYIDILAAVLAATAFSALLLWFAGLNHRFAERSIGRVLWQVGCAAAVIAIGFPLITGILVLTN